MKFSLIIFLTIFTVDISSQTKYDVLPEEYLSFLEKINLLEFDYYKDIFEDHSKLYYRIFITSRKRHTIVNYLYLDVDKKGFDTLILINDFTSPYSNNSTLSYGGKYFTYSSDHLEVGESYYSTTLFEEVKRNNADYLNKYFGKPEDTKEKAIIAARVVKKKNDYEVNIYIFQFVNELLNKDYLENQNKTIPNNQKTN